MLALFSGLDMVSKIGCDKHFSWALLSYVGHPTPLIPLDPNVNFHFLSKLKTMGSQAIHDLLPDSWSNNDWGAMLQMLPLKATSLSKVHQPPCRMSDCLTLTTTFHFTGFGESGSPGIWQSGSLWIRESGSPQPRIVNLPIMECRVCSNSVGTYQYV